MLYLASKSCRWFWPVVFKNDSNDSLYTQYCRYVFRKRTTAKEKKKQNLKSAAERHAASQRAYRERKKEMMGCQVYVALYDFFNWSCLTQWTLYYSRFTNCTSIYHKLSFLCFSFNASESERQRKYRQNLKQLASGDNSHAMFVLARMRELSRER